MSKEPPVYDLHGLNVFDPNDKLGKKSRYITLLHDIALSRYMPDGHGELAVDVGCGYGRLTPLLKNKGWKAMGIDPTESFIEYAKEHFPGPEYRIGQLPDLPLEMESVHLMLMQNILRALKEYGILDVVTGVGKFVAPGGKIVVVDNIRDGHSAYLAEAELVSLIEGEGFELINRVPIRAARSWMIYLIRYGLIPEKYFKSIALRELNRMSVRKRRPRLQYYNVMFEFCKVQ
ncbi:MAG: class I SAM-dependent methyltransferase [bacterium]